MRCSLLMMAVLYLISLSAYANTDTKCLSGAKSNRDMKISYENANNELVKIYKKFIEQCTKNQSGDYNVIISRFESAQKAWVNFRDANCSLIAASMLNGSGEALIQSDCLGDMTRLRMDELKKIESELLDRC